jgi:hypothetical protein
LKWNKEHYKKRDLWIKEDKKYYKRGAEQRYGKPQNKELNRKPGNKKSLYSNKTQCRQLQQTRTGGRQNLRAQR